MKIQYKILFKIILLTIILLIFNKIYTTFLYEKDIRKHSGIINQVRHAVNQNCEILYLGESSNTTCRDDDLDKRSISKFISGYYPSKIMGDITNGAIHAGIYYILLKNIPQRSNVKTVIVTLNLRSFNATWIYSNLETPLQKSMVLLGDYPPMVNRMLLSFKGYDHKTDSERAEQNNAQWKQDILQFPYSFQFKTVIDWNRAMATSGIKNTDGTINHDLTVLACHYIKTYAFQIDTCTNPRIRDFDNIVTLAAKRKWYLVFNLMAENTETANTLVGKDLLFLMEQNRRLLIDRYKRKGVMVVDNFNNIASDEYIDQNWTTEHYAENGRKTIAKNVADSLRKIYPQSFVNVQYPEVNNTTFFNNCDSDVLWNAMETITTEKSFSGNKSSKTNNLNNFSITFGYPMKKLPPWVDTIHVSFNIFITTFKKISIVSEFSGKNIHQIWMGVPLNPRTSLGRWSKVAHSFPITPEAKKADLLKIYVYNNSDSVAYVDDFKIVFH